MLVHGIHSRGNWYAHAETVLRPHLVPYPVHYTGYQTIGLGLCRTVLPLEALVLGTCLGLVSRHGDYRWWIWVLPVGLAFGLRAMLLATPNTAAHDTNSKCLVAQDLHGGLHPLCAVYHRDLLPAVANRIEHKWFKLQDLLKQIDAQAFSIADVSLLANINTPAQWETV